MGWDARKLQKKEIEIKGTEYRHPVDWLRTPGEFVRRGERLLLHRLAQDVAQRFERPTIVNVGVSHGATLHCLYAGAPQAEHIGIDIDLKRRPLRGAKALSDVKLIEMDSNQYRPKGPVHLAFIDGGHSYATVWGDIKVLVPHIPVGGVIAFHDYAPVPRDARRLAGLKRAIDEWHKSVGDAWALYVSADSIVAFQRVK